MHYLLTGLGLALLLVSGTVTADPVALDHLYDVELPSGIERDYRLVDQHLANDSLDAAISTIDQILDDNLALAESDPLSWGKLLANKGMIQTAAGRYQEAIITLETADAMIESNLPPFSREMIPINLARGITFRLLEDYDGSEEAFRKSQHIVHRSEGVYSPGQLPIVSEIVENNLIRQDLFNADVQQGFRQRVAEQAYGEASEDVIPVFEEIAAYYAQRGATISSLRIATGQVSFDANDVNSRYYRDNLFRQAFDLYDKVISIIEDNYGPNDLRLISPLRGIAAARLYQNYNRSASEDALERALSIIEENPASDVTDMVQAKLDLGDIYVVTGDKRAAETYESVWQMLADNPEQQILLADSFGTPTRIYPLESGIRGLERAPDAAEEGDNYFYAELSYSVLASGRVANVDVINRNVPNAEVRQLRADLLATRFRPRMVKGQAVDTHNMLLVQRYTVMQRPGPKGEVKADIKTAADEPASSVRSLRTP